MYHRYNITVWYSTFSTHKSQQKIPLHDQTTETKELSHRDVVTTSAACTRTLDAGHD